LQGSNLHRLCEIDRCYSHDIIDSEIIVIIGVGFQSFSIPKPAFEIPYRRKSLLNIFRFIMYFALLAIMVDQLEDTILI
jgi:hypothetical protein